MVTKMKWRGKISFIFHSLMKNWKYTCLIILNLSFTLSFIIALVISPNGMNKILRSDFLPWYHDIPEMQADFFKYQLILVGITLPIVAFGIFFLSHTINGIYSQRANEYRNLKIQGFQKKDFRHLFLLETFVISVICGPLILIIGNLLQVSILKTTIEQIFFNYTTSSSSTIFFASISLTNIIVSIGITFLLFLILLQKPLKRYAHLEIETIRENQQQQVNTAIEKMHINRNLIPLFIACLLPGMIIIFVPNREISGTVRHILDFFILCLYVLIPLMIFTGTYILSKLLVKRIKENYTQHRRIKNWKIQSALSIFRQKSPQISSQIFILSLMFCILLGGGIVYQTEAKYYEEKDLYLDGGGQYTELQIHKAYLTIEEILDIVETIENSTEQLEYRDLGYHINLPPIRNCYVYNNTNNQTILNCETLWSGQLINFNAYSQNTKIPEDWLINSTWEEIFDLLNEPNTALSPILPDRYGKKQFELNDSFFYNYTGKDGYNYSIPLKIVGFYKFFPMIDTIEHVNISGQFSIDYLVSENTVFPELVTQEKHSASLNLVFYEYRGILSKFESNILSILQNTFSSDDYRFSINRFTHYSPYKWCTDFYFTFDSYQFEKALIKYIWIEIEFIAIFTLIGSIFLMISNRIVTKDISARLRMQGAHRKDVIQIQVMINAIVVGTSFFGGFLGILGSIMLISARQFTHRRYLYIWNRDLTQIPPMIFITCLVGGIYILLYTLVNLYNTREFSIKRDLEKNLRIST